MYSQTRFRALSPVRSHFSSWARAVGQRCNAFSNDWKRCWAGLCLAFLAGTVSAQDVLTGDALLAQVRAALPEVSLQVAGELQERDRRGQITRVFPVEMEWHWGARPPYAEYVLFDRFGDPLERFRVVYPDGAPAEFAIWKGDAEEPLESVPFDQPMGNLDLSWSDLSLSFLWWPNGRIVGQERVRGRFCTIVELTVPASVEVGYDRIRLWIDPEVNLLMQADTLDRRGRLLRRLQVKSLRKIDEIWMVQNVDVINAQTRDRVTLRVRSVKALDDSFTAEWD